MTPAIFAVADRTPVLTAHAEGAQIYECKAGSDGQTVWAFREPIATLMVDGKTVGRHYAGPSWQIGHGEIVKGKVSASAPGAAPGDIALLKLDVVDHEGSGELQAASLVLRLNTHGGDVKGSCSTPGALRAEPYSADYLFLK